MVRFRFQYLIIMESFLPARKQQRQTHGMFRQYASPMYAADENGTSLTGFHLKYKKELSSVRLSFAKTVYCWEHELEIPVRIGETHTGKEK